MIAGVYAQSPHGDSYKVNCAACHNSAGWKINADTLHFNHDTTKFKLVGSHNRVNCKSCHSSLVFKEAPSQCMDCHKDVHSMSVGNDCARCHTPQNWLVDFIPELHEQNGFPLLGNHSVLSCVDCHVSETNLRFNRLGNECINCHSDEYSNAKSPDHKAGGFSTNCVECHDLFENGWKSNSVNHSFFPLEEGHSISDCKRCHLTNDFDDASPECASCHMPDYSSTSNPSHSSSNFPTDCKLCHTISGWEPSTFNLTSHHPLIGAHLTNPNNCNACHNGNYNNTPTACVGCHLSDYNTAATPNHSSPQFPTNCTLCHNQTSWSSSFDHDADHFPIYSSKHQGKWTKCSDCHNNSSNYSVFTCTGCHNNKKDLDDKHKTITGYSYGPTTCFNCHPQGVK